MTNPSLMRQEILEIPDAVDHLLSHGGTGIAQTAAALRTASPHFGITVARGSSDHACTYLQYISALLLGVPLASVGPSIASIYKAPLHLAGSFCLAISQSGKSPDIVEMARGARTGGALAIALTNDDRSPLADICDHALSIHAGPERSVAATKTFVTSVVAGLLLLAEWRQDAELIKAIHALPDILAKAAHIAWPDVRAAVGKAPSLYTLGRGPSGAISNEAALKFKETCQIHAESFSSAEVLHGPVSIVEAGFPVLCFAAADAAEDAVVQIADQIADTGAHVFITSQRAQKATALEHVRSAHPLTDPIALITSFYAMVEQVAADRGANPDAPRHLKKVTETT